MSVIRKLSIFEDNEKKLCIGTFTEKHTKHAVSGKGNSY